MSLLDRITWRYRVEPALLLLPLLRCFALAFFVAGGIAALVAGLLFLDYFLWALVNFIVALFFLGIGTALWGFE